MRRITLGSIYALNDQIEPFIKGLFNKINEFDNVFHVIGGDWNMIQNFDWTLIITKSGIIKRVVYY